MKTNSYNPSQLEVELANIFLELQEQINKKFKNNEVLSMKSKIDADNPLVKIHLLDNDGDPHEIVIRIIQTPDKF